MQWIIPNLYLSGSFDGIIDWNLAPQKQHYSSNRYIFEKDRLLLAHDIDYLFIGRRKDKARILKPFLAKQPILLKGLGGVGKTALAEHLVQRLVAADPKSQPFVFNEKHKSIEDILNALKDFLMSKLRYGVITGLSQLKKGMDKFVFLLSEVVKDHQPVFVFDNLESFQAEPGEEFALEYGDIKEIIDFLCDALYGQFHVILTCRYPVPGVKNLDAFDLNQVGLNDFWKKCFYLDVGHIHTYLREAEAEAAEKKHGVPGGKAPQFIDIVKLLHRVFGGNYRCLEFFNLVLKESPAKIRQSLGTLEHFLENSKKEVDQVREKMGKNLLFEQLLALLDARQQGILGLLAQFRAPVQEWALELQIEAQDKPVPGVDSASLVTLLAGLQRLTLIEVSLDREVGLHYYYVTPIVRDLLAGAGESAGPGALEFDHERAGLYFYSAALNMGDRVTDWEEGFYHYDRIGNLDKVEEIGDVLSRFYYKYSMFHSAFFYANRVYALKGDETKGTILNSLGTIYKVYGDYNRSLKFFEKAQVKAREEGNKVAEGSLMNNISQIYKTRGDYNTALHYLVQSLEIKLELKDQAGRGVVLNNIGQIYFARGDYKNAFLYLEQSLKIRQKFGDKAGEGVTLNNISQLYSAQCDCDTALQYLEKSLKIFQEIGDKKNEGITLNNISQIYDARGDVDTALQYLEQSLKIRQEMGDKSGEGTTLDNIGQIYIDRCDYDTALQYLEQSLKIRQEMGDKSGQGTTLNNISQIYQASGDYEIALRYLEQSLKIKQEIRDKDGISAVLYNMAGLAFSKKDIKKYKEYNQEAYRLALETGNAFHIYRIGADLGYFLYRYGVSEIREQALAMLRKSLAIGKKAGYPDVGELEEFLKGKG